MRKPWAQRYAGYTFMVVLLLLSIGAAAASGSAPTDPVACPEGQTCPGTVEKPEDPGTLASGGKRCRAAWRALVRKGFHDVQTIECGGRNYVFTGWQYGSLYIVKVSARSGRVLSAEAQRLKALPDQ